MLNVVILRVVRPRVVAPIGLLGGKIKRVEMVLPNFFTIVKFLTAVNLFTTRIVTTVS